MKTKIILLIIIAAICGSCENEQIVEISDSYIEKVVVRAELVKDSLFEGVQITKTLPLNSSYEENKAKLKNFTGYLRINDVQVIPLHYTNGGIYKPLYKMVVKGNTKYELIANGDGKQFYAQTFVPDTAYIRKVYYKNDRFLEAVITPSSQYVYGATWVLDTHPNDIQADDFFNIAEPLINSGQVTVQTKEIPGVYLNNPLMRIQVYTFDKNFSTYFKTKKYSQSISNTFGQGGGPVDWNVEGENVIGIFIGYTKSQFLKPTN